MQETILSTSEPGFRKTEKSKWFNEHDYLDSLNIKLPEDYQQIYPSDLSNNINDSIITLSFKAAIEINSGIFVDKTVLVMHSGLGLYSILAAQQGAKKVYALEPNNTLAAYATRIVSDNQLSNIITVMSNDIYSLFIPSKVDIIICQWMGYFLLHQSFLHEMIFARERLLHKGGIIFPDKATIYLSSIEDVKYKYDKLEAWDNVYGINMDCIKTESLGDPLVNYVKENQIISTICPIYSIDLYTIDYPQLNFSNAYEIEFNNNDEVSALVAWFDVEFNNVPNQIKFTTSPFNKSTKWRQTVFYLNKDIRVKKGDVAKGSFCCRTNEKLENMNGLDIKISFHAEKKKHHNETRIVQMYKMK